MKPTGKGTPANRDPTLYPSIASWFDQYLTHEYGETTPIFREAIWRAFVIGASSMSAAITPAAPPGTSASDRTTLLLGNIQQLSLEAFYAISEICPK